MYIWTLIKHKGLAVDDKSGFVANLTALQKSGTAIPYVAQIQELNRARVGFKHFGNLPAPIEAEKHRTHVEEFLRQAMRDHFGIDFDSLTLIDLVADPDIRAHLQAAQREISAEKYGDATTSLAKARYLAYGLLREFLPGVGGGLRDADRLLARAADVQGFYAFQQLAEYLAVLREAALVAMFHLPVKDFALLRANLPSVSRSLSGAWLINGSLVKPSEEVCNKALAAVVNICIRVQSRA